MLGGDEIDFSTQVPAIRRVWVPVTMSCHVSH
jgi:hypothetical protein